MSSVTISFTVDSSIAQRIANDLCSIYGYQNTLDDGSANTETRSAFAKRMIWQMVKNTCFSYEARIGSDALRQQTAADINTSIVYT